MGQAKQRGTFWQRRTESEARRIAEGLARRELERMIEAAVTPEEKEARRKAQMFLTMTAGLVAGMNSVPRNR